MNRVLVVGGGAAGMMAAIAAAREGAPTVLLEKTGQLGLKIRISGGGRCNITNDQGDPAELVKMFPGHGRFLMDAFRRFSKNDLLKLLRDFGVETKVEPPYAKVFPVSDRSTDVIAALVAAMQAWKVDVRLDTPVENLIVDRDRIKGVSAKGNAIEAGAVVICTGGLSFPRSGSTGDGYRLAKIAGHTVTETFPSLVPLRVEGTRPLSGVALRDVEGTILVDGKIADRKFRGDVLFTHWGFSGPIILQLSRGAADGIRKGKTATLKLDLVPDLTADELDKRLLREFATQSNAQLATILHSYMPKSVVPFFTDKASLDATRNASEVSRGERQRLVEALRGWRFPVSGWHSMEAAEVTAGGVSVKEVDPRTFASKRVEGLFWAGEVLDVDGYVGGYNLQAAWSSGYVAGVSAARYVG